MVLKSVGLSYVFTPFIYTVQRALSLTKTTWFQVVFARVIPNPVNTPLITVPNWLLLKASNLLLVLPPAQIKVDKLRPPDTGYIQNE